MQPRDHHDCISMSAYNGITSSTANQCKQARYSLDKYNALFDLGGEKPQNIELQRLQFQTPTKKYPITGIDFIYSGSMGAVRRNVFFMGQQPKRDEAAAPRLQVQPVARLKITFPAGTRTGARTHTHTETAGHTDHRHTEHSYKQTAPASSSCSPLAGQNGGLLVRISVCVYRHTHTYRKWIPPADGLRHTVCPAAGPWSPGFPVASI